MYSADLTITIDLMFVRKVGLTLIFNMNYFDGHIPDSTNHLILLQVYFNFAMVDNGYVERKFWVRVSSAPCCHPSMRFCNILVRS